MPWTRQLDEKTESVDDTTGQIAEIGRGESDPDITYIALRNESGQKRYIFPDAAGTGIVVQAAKP